MDQDSSDSKDGIKKNRIMFDLTFLFDQYAKRGIGVYGKHLISRLLEVIDEDPNFEIYLLGFNSLEQNLIHLGFSQFRVEELSHKFNFYSFGAETDSNIKNFLRWEKTYLPAIEEIKPDIFYAVHFERGLPSTKGLREKLSYRPRTAVVAHDAIPLVTNKFSSKGFIQNFLKKRFFKRMWTGVQNADLVITVSQFSKEDLIRYGGIDESKIKVIYSGVNEKYRRENYDLEKDIEENILEAYSLLNKNYFIFDTGVEPNKGTVHLLNIFKEILNSGSHTLPNYLVITGKDFYKGAGTQIKPKTILGEQFIKMAKKLGVLQNLITTDKIPDEHLVTVFFNAKVYINLSTYEGFGLGIAQAMTSKIPVIAANASCIPEITQGGAYLIDIRQEMDYKKITEDLIKHLNDKDKVKEKIKKASKVAQQYDWDKTVEMTWRELKKLAVEADLQ